MEKEIESRCRKGRWEDQVGGKERDGPEVKGRLGGIWIITIIHCCHVPGT